MNDRPEPFRGVADAFLDSRFRGNDERATVLTSILPPDTGQADTIIGIDVKGVALLTQTTEYALRAAVDLAYHRGESRTTQQIAAATQVPAGYLAKVLKALSRSGLIRSQRGLHGGFVLEHDPEEITVYDVVAAVDPPKRIRECPLGLEAHKHQLCPLHQRLDDALAMVEQTFRDTTIAEVTADPSRKPLGGKRIELTISGGLAPQGAGRNGRTRSSRKKRKR